MSPIPGPLAITQFPRQANPAGLYRELCSLKYGRTVVRDETPTVEAVPLDSALDMSRRKKLRSVVL